MNCFNGSKYLNKSIESIINQTYQNWELIFWDNKSLDNSIDIAKSYNNNKFQIFESSKNTKLYKARNKALNKVKGDIICFLDTDDWWSKKKLNIYNKAFNEYQCNFVYSNFYNYYQDSYLKYRIFKILPQPNGLIKKKLEKDYVVSLPTLAFKTSCINLNNDTFNNNFNIIGDFDFVMRLSTNNRCKYLYTPSAYYRIHSNNYSNLNIKEHISELGKWSLNKEIDLKNNIEEKINLLKCLNYLNIKNYKAFFIHLANLVRFKNKLKLFLFFLRSLFV